MNHHHYGHCKDILVKVGDIVDVNTLLGHVGKSGTDYAHLHYEVMNRKPPSWGFYPIGKSKEYVASMYLNPKQFIDKAKNLPCKWTSPTAGLRFLQYYKPQNVYHAGEDLNSGSGNADLGNEIRSTVYGKVVYVGRNQGGWGNHIWVEELPKPQPEPPQPIVTLPLRPKIKVILHNMPGWDPQVDISVVRGWYKEFSMGIIDMEIKVVHKNFDKIPFMVVDPFTMSYGLDPDFAQAKIVDNDYDATILVIHPAEFQSGHASGKLYGRTTGFIFQKPTYAIVAAHEGLMSENYPMEHALFDYIRHELMHTFYIFGGSLPDGQNDYTHQFMNPVSMGGEGNPEKAFTKLNYQRIGQTLLSEPMAQKGFPVLAFKYKGTVYVPVFAKFVPIGDADTFLELGGAWSLVKDLTDAEFKSIVVPFLAEKSILK